MPPDRFDSGPPINPYNNTCYGIMGRSPEFLSPYLGPDIVPGEPTDQSPTTSCPDGWKEHHFRYGYCWGSRYFIHAESAVVTTFDIRYLLDAEAHVQEQFARELDSDRQRRADSHGQYEYYFYPAMQEEAIAIRYTIDHKLQTVYANQDVYDSEASHHYYEWLRRVYDSHMRTSVLGKVAAMTELEKCHVDHVFCPGQNRIFTLEQADQLMSIVQLDSPFNERAIRMVLERIIHVYFRNEVKKPPKFFAVLNTYNKKKVWWKSCAYNFVAMGLCFKMPLAYRSRLYVLCTAEDRQLNDRWNGLLPSLCNEWSQLNVVLALLLSASGALLAVLPSDELEAARFLCLASTFVSLSGVIHTTVLLNIHQPSLATDLIFPGSSAGITQAIAYIRRADVDVLSVMLSIPVVHLVWAVLTFAGSLTAWVFTDPWFFRIGAICSVTVTVVGPLIIIWFFLGVWEWADKMILNDGYDGTAENPGEILVRPKDPEEHQEELTEKIKAHLSQMRLRWNRRTQKVADQESTGVEDDKEASPNPEAAPGVNFFNTIFRLPFKQHEA